MSTGHQESDVRIIAAELKRLRDDTHETNKELREVAKSLNDVAKNLEADRGRLNHMDYRVEQAEKEIRITKDKISPLEKFVAIEGPKAIRREKVFMAIVISLSLFALKTVFNI